jgi:putative tryptophan/tyrosine transport system substrate-binding protein
MGQGKTGVQREEEYYMSGVTVNRLFLYVVLFLIVVLFSVEARAEKKIGILSFSEEARFIEVQKGILDQLKKSGFGESAAKYTIENAKGSKAKAAELAQKFAAAKFDMVITIGTTATVVAAKAIKETPLVFSLVYDPVESGIAKGWKSSGNNTTGSSTQVSMSTLVSRMKLIAPVKTLAVLYTPGEKHTEVMLKDLQKLQAEFQIKVIPIILSRKEEASQVLPDVVRTVDAIALTGSSVQVASIREIVDMAIKAKVITITHVEELVEQGVLLGVVPDPHMIGQLAGEKAVKVLKGAKPSSVPIEPLKKLETLLNKKTANASQIQIPPALLKQVTRTIE